MVDIGKSCTETDDCTLPNIYCAYPDCVRGRIKKEAEPVIVSADTAFLAGVKAGLNAGLNVIENCGCPCSGCHDAISAIDPATITPVTEKPHDV